MLKKSFIKLILINVSWISYFLIFLYSLFVFVNGPQAWYVNPDCLKCISGKSLSPANKKLFTISFILYYWHKRGPTKAISLKAVFIPKLPNNPLASSSLINFDLLFHSRCILIKVLFFRFLYLQILGFYFLHFFDTPSNMTTSFYK